MSARDQKSATAVNPERIVYLHGFNSHPDSFKAQVTRQACQSLPNPPEFIAPHLSPSPLEAYQQVVDIIDSGNGSVQLIGSSFGGFIATVLAEERALAGTRLINPAINLIPLAKSLVGKEHVNPDNGSTVRIEKNFIDELEQLTPATPQHPEKYQVLLGGSDELLNYQDALRFYRGAHILILPNEGHALNAYPLFADRLFQQL